MNIKRRWRLPLAIVTITIFLYAIFADALQFMAENWASDEYSHGYLIPFVAAYLFWLKAGRFPEDAWSGSKIGIFIVVAGLVLWGMGELSTLYVITQYAFLLTLTGIVISLVSWKYMRFLWAPLAYLIFMIPLPDFLYVKLSAQLQLISSQLGVEFMRLFGILVNLQGNVIDLGNYQLQVAEACSGLRYLFPLTSFGFLCAYLFKGPLWQKVLLFISTIPITVLMNSFRIGIIGILVEYWGIEMAEGFIHDFEGWIVFVACLGILFLEIWVLVLLGGKRTKLADALALDAPILSSTRNHQSAGISLPGTFMISVLMLGIAVFISLSLESRQEFNPERQRFVSFPLQVGAWNGRESSLEQIYINALKLDDYILANYVNHESRIPVNLYAAYYASQRKGASVHSPSTCIPGGGWKITDYSRATMNNSVKNTAPEFEINRVIIEKGREKQLVYYWFPQRGRHLANEYLVKWYLFWDSLTQQRSDGGLVRLVTSVAGEEQIRDADRRITKFFTAVYPLLGGFFPE